MVNNEASTERRYHLLTEAIGVVVILIMALILAACQPAEQTPAPQPFGGDGQRPNFQMQPAPQLPTDQPAVQGTLVNESGTTLTVQEGGFGFSGNFGGGNATPRALQNGTPRSRPTPGPTTDIQVDAGGATVYEDTTFANLNGQPPSGTIQQTVVASSLDKIPANARVTVWGTLNGTQATAKVIVFSQFQGFQRSPQP